jgi:hypothetical protein
MKRFLFALLAGFVPALVATNGAFAQNSVNTVGLEAQNNVPAIEKAVNPGKDHAADKNAVSPKALKIFTKTYKNVTGENWEKTSEGFTAKFNSAGVRTIIYFNRKGKWEGSLQGYGEEKMPPEVRKIIKREYYDYSITYVQEAQTIDSDGIPTYIVHLEDAKSIIKLRIHDGNMEVWQEFNKQL